MHEIQQNRMWSPFNLFYCGYKYRPDLKDRVYALDVFYKVLAGFLGGPLSSVERDLLDVQNQMNVLDRFPQHDKELDDATYELIRFRGQGSSRTARRNPFAQGFGALTFELEEAVKIIGQAQVSVEGLLRGQRKDKIEGPLFRLAGSAAAVLAIAEQMKSEHREWPRKPYEIRKAALAVLCRQWQTVAQEMIGIRQGLQGSALDPEMLQAFKDDENMFLRLRSRLGKLRDNPSRKIGAAIQGCIDDLKGIKVRLGELDDRVRPLAKQLLADRDRAQIQAIRAQVIVLPGHGHLANIEEGGVDRVNWHQVLQTYKDTQARAAEPVGTANEAARV